jgi:hypothetical protein
MTTNYLKAVFWDYPELCNPEAIEKKVREARSSNDRKTLTWIMGRFLERGRFKETVSLFGKEEIRENLDDLAISDRARKKWERFLEVYGKKD